MTGLSFGNESLSYTTRPMKEYLKQPSTWLGLVKLGTAIGLYSTGIGGAVAQGVMAIFGVIDVIRNEKR